MRIVGISLNLNLIPYVQFINGHKNKFKKGIEQNGYPLDQAAYISEPRPLKNSLLNSFHGIIIPGSLLNLFEKSLVQYGELLPINVENVGNCKLVNITNLKNEYLSYEDSIFRHYHENIDKEGKFIEPKYLAKSKLNPQNILFLKEKIKSPAFVITHNNLCYGPFFTIGIFPEEHEFASLLIKYNIKGIDFIDIKLI
jgi:hypothetical protein